jgi:septal ring factor EnvC (AmiA/AmiB activator)
MNTELFTFIAPIATFITMLVGFITIIKFLFSLNDRITKLEIETKTGFIKLEAEHKVTNNRLESVEKRLDGVEKRLDGVEKRLDGVEKHLGIYDEQTNKTNTKVDTMQIQVAENTKQIEIFNKQIIEVKQELKEQNNDNRNLMDKVLDKLELPKEVFTPKTTIL